MSDVDLVGAAKGITRPTSRILTIDIERLPGTAYAWEPKTRYISPGQWIEWPRLLCWAARWYGQSTMRFESEWTDRDRMIEEAWNLYHQADVVVTYNGVRFDDKHLRTEWIEAGLGPPSPWKTVDLYKVVQQFGFESKSLDSVTRRLGRPGKQHRYSIDEAVRASEGDRTAQRNLKTYNAGDVELTEWLFDRLRPWIHNHPHVATAGDDKLCNRCGSDNLEHQKRKYRAVVLDYALWKCLDCGGWLRTSWSSRAASTRGVK